MDEQFEIEVFRPGTFTPMSGAALTFTAETLSAIADAYDAEGSPAPAVVGHPTTDAPAFGWASSFRYDGERERLIATVGDLAPAFAAAVKAKTYRKVSMSFHRPADPANPKPGAWYPKHIGFLGGAAPAVPGLKTVSFSGKAEDAVTIEFGDAGFRDTASLFQRMRDFMIEQFGLEKADAVLPGFEIEWLRSRADDPTPAPGFSSPTVPEDTSLTTPADFAAREAALAARERQIAEREAGTVHAAHVAFAADLVTANTLLPAMQAEVVGLLDALAAGATPMEASFSNASNQPVKEPAIDTFKRLLKAMPKAVEFSTLPRDPATTAAPASFAAPDGFQVDRDAMDLHAKAAAFQAANPSVSWLDAVRAAQAGR